MTDLRVLVIDDEELVRDVLVSLLRRLGVEVVAERDGEEGVRRYAEARAAGRGFDAVLVDLSLAGRLGGLETIRALLRVDPGCRAIVCSGLSGDPAVVDYEAHGFSSRITKPFRMADLRRALWEATGRADGRRDDDGDGGSEDGDGAGAA